MSNTFFGDGNNTAQLFSEFLSTQTLGSVAAVPVLSLVQAQSAANQEYLKYVKDVLLDEKNQLRTFDVELPVKGADSTTSARAVKIPLLAILTHPTIAIQDAKIEYTVNVVDKRVQSTDLSKGPKPSTPTINSAPPPDPTTNPNDPNNTQQPIPGDASQVGQGDSQAQNQPQPNPSDLATNPMLSMRATISCSSERKRSTDTSASMMFVTNVARVPPSEGMNRLIDALLG